MDACVNIVARLKQDRSDVWRRKRHATGCRQADKRVTYKITGANLPLQQNRLFAKMPPEASYANAEGNLSSAIRAATRARLRTRFSYSEFLSTLVRLACRGRCEGFMLCSLFFLASHLSHTSAARPHIRSLPIHPQPTANSPTDCAMHN